MRNNNHGNVTRMGILLTLLVMSYVYIRKNYLSNEILGDNYSKLGDYFDVVGVIFYNFLMWDILERELTRIANRDRNQLQNFNIRLGFFQNRIDQEIDAPQQEIITDFTNNF